MPTESDLPALNLCVKAIVPASPVKTSPRSFPILGEEAIGPTEGKGTLSDSNRGSEIEGRRGEEGERRQTH